MKILGYLYIIVTILDFIILCWDIYISKIRNIRKDEKIFENKKMMILFIALLLVYLVFSPFVCMAFLVEYISDRYN